MPTHRFLRSLIALAAMMPLAAAAAPPQLETLVPLAASADKSQEVSLLGTKLEGVTALWFSHPGIRATAAEQKGQWRIDVAAEVPAGDYDVWAVSGDGMSAPRRFVVSTHGETTEREKNELPGTAEPLAVPAAVTARIDPATDRDCYRFRLARGQRVTIECRSLSLDGTVLPALTLFGPDGHELLHDDGRQPEPRLHCIAHAAGEYVVRVEERAFRKGANNVYRLEVSDAPWLTAAFPSAVVRGERRKVTLYGVGMPTGSANHAPSEAERDSGPAFEAVPLELELPHQASLVGNAMRRTNALFVDHFDYQQAGHGGSVRFELVDQPPLVEQEEFSDSMKGAQELTLPSTVAGRFLARNDVDWFRFAAQKDQAVWIEGVAERSGRRLDLELVVHDAKGKVLQTLADTAQPKEGPARLPLATLDPQDLFTAPAEGEYFLAVRDLLGPAVAGPDRSYLLKIGPRQEQLAVVAMPAAAAQGLSIRAGGKAALELFAVRRGGHQGAVRIQASQLPEGVSAKEVVIDAKKSTGTMTLVATAEAADWLGPIELTAETKLDGKPCTLPVQPAATIHEAPPALTRFTQSLPLAVLPAAKKK